MKSFVAVSFRKAGTRFTRLWGNHNGHSLLGEVQSGLEDLWGTKGSGPFCIWSRGRKGYCMTGSADNGRYVGFLIGIFPKMGCIR